MNSHETRVDIWSRVLLAIALLLLVIHQVHVISPPSAYPRVLIPSASSALLDAPRYPQALPARDNVNRQLNPRPYEPKVATARQGSLVF